MWLERLTLQLCEMAVAGVLQLGRPPREAREILTPALQVGSLPSVDQRTLTYIPFLPLSEQWTRVAIRSIGHWLC